MSNEFKQHKHDTVMTNDTTWTGAIPPGYMLESIVFVNSTGNAATLDLGKTSGASDVFVNQVIAASGITVVDINEVFSMTARQSLFINDDDAGSSWNSSSLIAILNMRRVLL